MLMLRLVGLGAAAVVWQQLHPAAGAVVGLLFITSVGWRLLGMLLGLLRPSARQAYGAEGRQFIAAWEYRFGQLHPSSGANEPPPGLFQQWLAAHRETGISADDWLVPLTGRLGPHHHLVEVMFEPRGSGATFLLTLPPDGQPHRLVPRVDDAVGARYRDRPDELSRLLARAQDRIEVGLDLPRTAPTPETDPDDDGHVRVLWTDALRALRAERRGDSPTGAAPAG